MLNQNITKYFVSIKCVHVVKIWAHLLIKKVKCYFF